MDSVKKGVLWTAADWPSEDIDNIRYRFETLLGVKVTLDVFVDKEIIGGFIVHINGRVYDASMRTKLNALREHLSA